MTAHGSLRDLDAASSDLRDRTAALDRAQRRLDWDLRAFAYSIFPGNRPTQSSRPVAQRRPHRAAPARRAAAPGGGAISTPDGPAAH